MHKTQVRSMWRTLSSGGKWNGCKNNYTCQSTIVFHSRSRWSVLSSTDPVAKWRHTNDVPVLVSKVNASPCNRERQRVGNHQLSREFLTIGNPPCDWFLSGLWKASCGYTIWCFWLIQEHYFDTGATPVFQEVVTSYRSLSNRMNVKLHPGTMGGFRRVGRTRRVPCFCRLRNFQ